MGCVAENMKCLSLFLTTISCSEYRTYGKTYIRFPKYEAQEGVAILKVGVC